MHGPGEGRRFVRRFFLSGGRSAGGHRCKAGLPGRRFCKTGSSVSGFDKADSLSGLFYRANLFEDGDSGGYFCVLTEYLPSGKCWKDIRIY